MSKQPETLESMLTEIGQAAADIRAGKHRGNTWKQRLTAHRMLMATLTDDEAVLVEADEIARRWR